MNHELAHVLGQLLITLGLALVVLVACARVRIPPVVGLILTGAVVGPAGLKLVADRHLVELFAEVGVVLLLFSVGLELSLERLARAQRAFAVAGPLQALCTAGATILVAMTFGLSFAQSTFIAFLTVLSSTAVVLKLYNDRRELRTPAGELSLGILLFQDLAMVPMVVVTPLLAGVGEGGLAALGTRLGGAVLAAIAAFVLARVLLPPMLRILAGTGAREAFLLGALVLGVGMAYLTGVLGLSPALGAFLAGVAAAETRYHHQLMADVGPFRDVFTSLFFVSLGMMVVLPKSAAGAGAVLAVALGAFLLKTGTGFVAIRAAGFASGTALTTSMGLAQLGEFSFLLLALGLREQLLPMAVHETLVSAAVLTLLATPLALRIAPRLAARLPNTPPASTPEDELRDHVILVGYGQTSRILGRVLKDGGFRYEIVDLSEHDAERARVDGHPVMFGDASRPEILQAAGVERARVLVVAISDLAAEMRIVRIARDLNPNLRIVAVARTTDEIERVARLGSDRVVALEFESAIEVLHEVLGSFHVPANVIRAQARALRGEDYRILRSDRVSRRASEALLDALVEGTTEVARVRPGSPAAGNSLRGLDLRRHSKASVIALVREGDSIGNPDPDLELRVGDDLVIVGAHAEVAAALVLLRPPPSPED